MGKKKVSRKQRMIHISTPFGSRTDVGCVRERNEDSLVVSPPLFAVADGMGGHAGGDLASETAVRSLQMNAPDTADVEALGRAVCAANYAVIDEATRLGLGGMGTTMTACIVEGDQLAIAHVGDSRAYLLHHGKLQQITRDHSLMADMVEAGRITREEARTHPNRSIITRALGSDPQMQPDLYELTASVGDRLLICSDGLHAMVPEHDIQNILARTRDPQRCAAQLVNEAIGNGGADNCTVIVVDITADSAIKQRKTTRKHRFWMIFAALALVALLAGTAYGANYYFHNIAYLTNKDGYVTIYRGMDGNLFGVETHWLEEQTDIPVAELQPGVQKKLEEGIQTQNVEEARKVAESYRADIERERNEAAATEAKRAENAEDRKNGVKKKTTINDTSSESTSGGA